MQWYEPLNFFEWLRRVFSFFNLGVFILTCVFVFSEFRFNWYENLVGSYLASTNGLRPQTGAIWEKDRHTSNAHQNLNDIVNKQQNIKNDVLKTSSFEHLLSSILPGEWVTLERQQFKNIYLSLEAASALRIIEPVRLIRLLNEASLDRIFCQGVMDGIKIYFIDSENRVIKQLDINKNDILEIENRNRPFTGTLEALDGFQGRIYPADIFFGTVFNMPSDIIPDLIVNPEKLLKEKGSIQRIGIWNEAEGGYIKLGFEFKTGNTSTRKVVFVKGREWAVWQLSMSFKGDSH